MEHVLRNALFALIEWGEATLPGVLRLLTDRAFRTAVLSRVRNENVRAVPVAASSISAREKRSAPWWALILVIAARRGGFPRMVCSAE